MTIVRLLADDLTGALDTAAEFVPLTGELPVFWPDADPRESVGSLGLDSGTREGDPAAAAARVERLAASLQGADIAFKKIDSLIRGATLAEIAACTRAGFWRYCILAAAFPYQGRITRAGRQYRNDNGKWMAVGEDLAAGLRGYGVLARHGGVGGGDLLPGITVFDAETDEDLRRIVSTGMRSDGPVLWAGTGGLAQALAAGCSPPALAALPGPILGLFGSDQMVTAGQLAACEPHWLHVEHHALDAVPRRLAEAGLALVSFRLPPNTPRAAAATQIAGAIARLINQVDRPGTVVVAGGETLRSLCDAIGADALSVRGRLVPGVPLSVVQGGQWDGVTIVSKSGAFGHASLLRELILERADQ
jgi:D-threonate/D-erythronate kinase